MEEVARSAVPDWRPEGAMVEDARAFTPFLYGLLNWDDLYSSRQILALTTLSDLVTEVHERVKRDAAVVMPGEDQSLNDGGRGAMAYGDAVAVLVALCVDKVADYNNTICMWNPTNENVGHLFTKQVIAMTWDFVESSPLHGGLSFEIIARGVAKSIEMLPAATPGWAIQADACGSFGAEGSLVLSTDPPYFDNVPYADLSDFFYVWLRRSMKLVLPDLFGTLAVPKAEELVATSYRHGGRSQAEVFFMNGMTQAMHQLAAQAHPAFPVTIYYAFKQSETENTGTVSTGWETFLDAVFRAGFALSGTWPVRTERATRSRGIGSNALASSIVLVCRPRTANEPTATRREFLTALKSHLPEALKMLQRGNIAPVDLAQAAIGPGMAVYTRFAKVLEADGKSLSVRDALALINQTLDEALAEQEGDFDADTRWAVAWFEQAAFEAGDYGVAETLSKAKNTSVAGMVDAKFLSSRGGKVRLLRPDELAADWDPANDPRLTAWEVVHQLIRVLEAGGEGAAAELVATLGSKAEPARELAYRLYTICERKKRAPQALSYNALVQSWPEITRLAADAAKHVVQPQQGEFFS
jgi:putative DNA methylase